jgi:putative ABC transport system permease protein
MIIKIAWRNIWRHRMRSIVIIASVAAGLWAGLYLMAFYYGTSEQRVNTAISQEISHLQIHNPEFKKDYEVRYIIPGARGIIDEIAKMPGVKAVTGRTISRAMASTASGSSGIMLNGVDPPSEDIVTQLHSKIIDGRYLDSGKRNRMLVGQKLAHKLKLKVGSKAVFTFLDKDLAITSAAFRVEGIYKTQNTPYDEMNVFVRGEELNNLIGLPGSTNEIAILLESNNFIQTVYDRLKSEHPDLLVETWKEISPEMDLIVSVTDQSMYIFMAIILLALAFGIINTMLMAVLERTRELGMLMALGMKKSGIFFMILWETIFLVMAGCPFGVLFSVVSVYYSGKYGLDLSVFQDSLASFGYAAIIYPKLETYHYVVMLVMVAATAIISSIFPARKALKLEPADAIRK